MDGVKRPIVNDTSYGPYGGTITGNELDFTGLPLNLTSVNTNALGAYLANGRDYQNFLGLMDDIALYNRALTESEVAGIYSGVASLSATKSNSRLYLNPMEQILCIHGLDETAELSVFNMNGLQIASTKGTSIQIASLPLGSYLLRVHSATETFTEKFSKQ